MEGLLQDVKYAIRTLIKSPRFSVIAGSAHAVIHSIDPQQPVGHVRTMEDVVSDSVKAERFLMLLLAIFAGCALLLACIGLYGVVSYTVAQRTQEIGVRMAFGASRGDIAKLVVQDGMMLVVSGTALGVAGSLMLTRFLSNMLFHVNTTDPITYLGVSLLLASIALVACFIPARRAMLVEPVTALRYE